MHVEWVKRMREDVTPLFLWVIVNLFIIVAYKKGKNLLIIYNFNLPISTCYGCLHFVFSIDKKRLADYARVCGHSEEDLIAALPCYLETYFLPLFICMATSKAFRLSPLGRPLLCHFVIRLNGFSVQESHV